MGKEKRRHKRIYIDIDLIAQVRKDTDQEFHQSFVKDISEGGVRIILAIKIKPETNVHINFQIPEIMSQPIEVSGKTIWEKWIAKEKGYVHGVKFIDVNLNHLYEPSFN